MSRAQTIEGYIPEGQSRVQKPQLMISKLQQLQMCHIRGRNMTCQNPTAQEQFLESHITVKQLKTAFLPNPSDRIKDNKIKGSQFPLGTNEGGLDH